LCSGSSADILTFGGIVNRGRAILRGAQVEMTAESLTLRPTPRAKRIELVDLTRGAALFGVLLVNTVYVAGFTVPQSEYPGGASPLLLDLLSLFVNLRFLGLFSILFGLGFILQIRRAREKGAPFRARYLRRIVILFLIGLIHSLLYPGDILKLYATLGLLLPFVYRWSARTLVGLSLACVVFSGVGPALTKAVPSVSSRFAPDARGRFELSAFCQDTNEPFEGQIDAYAEGSFTQVLAINACRIPREFRGLLRGWVPMHVFGLFLIGVLLGTTEFFMRIPEWLPQILKWTLICGIVGFTLLGVQTWVPNVESGALLAFADTTMAFGYYLTTLAYGGAIILIYKRGWGERVLRPLAAVGRTALTVYLLQSVIYCTAFLGYGLSWDIRMGVPSILGFAIAVYLAEVAAFNLWLKYFRFGPAEWLWRSLTYMRWQPFLTDRLRRSAGGV
jgi:uncharacterized protein